MREPTSDCRLLWGNDHVRSCSRCHREMRSVRPWWSDLEYICNECGDEQRLKAAG